MGWTDTARRQHMRNGPGYPSDLRDGEWALIEPMLPPARSGGRPRTTRLRAVMEAILYPGAAEVVNVRPPSYLIREGVDALPCIGDGRQSGTAGSPSILNASPEAAAMGGLALIRSGDRVRVDLGKGTVNVLIDDAELDERRRALAAAGGFPYPASQTPRQAMQRAVVGQMETGAILEGAQQYQRIAQTAGLPRDNH